MRLLQRALFWFSWPFLWFYFRQRRRVRVLVSQGTNTLLVKGWWSRLYGDKGWGLPGGGLKYHEDPAAGAVRELYEELGLTIRLDDLQPLGQLPIKENGISYEAIFFGTEQAVKPEIQQSPEIIAAEWLNLNVMSSEELKPEVTAALQLLKSQ